MRHILFVVLALISGCTVTGPGTSLDFGGTWKGAGYKQGDLMSYHWQLRDLGETCQGTGTTTYLNYQWSYTVRGTCTADHVDFVLNDTATTWHRPFTGQFRPDSSVIIGTTGDGLMEWTVRLSRIHN